MLLIIFEALIISKPNNIPMKSIKPLLLIIFALPFSFSLFSQCDCSDLKNAFYTTTKSANTGDYIKDVRTFYGTDGFSNFIKEKEKGKGKYRISIPVEGVSYDTKPNTDPKVTDYDLVKGSILGGSNKYYNIGWANFMVCTIVSDSVVDAYFKCINKCPKTGLSVSLISDNGSKMALLLKYIPSGDTKETKIDDIIVYGADVLNPISMRDGASIDAEGKVIIMKKKEGEDLVISVNMRDGKGTKYINYTAKSAINDKDKPECTGEWLNLNSNYDSTLVNFWAICSDSRKKSLTSEGKDATMDLKYNNLKNMIYALNNIKDVKNNVSSLLSDPNKNAPEIFLQLAKLEMLETQYNTDRTSYLGNSNLIKPCNTCYSIY